MKPYIKSNKGINRIIVLNIIFFLLANIITSSLRGSGSEIDFLSNFALSSNWFNVVMKPWTIITSMFLHIDILHILFNMLYLFVFGKILSSRLGSQSVVSVYIFGGIVGALFYVLFYSIIPGTSDHLALGASGGVMAVMAAATTLSPDKRLRLFLFGDIKLKWIFLVLFILTSVYNIDVNTGGKIDHMGGAFYGFLYITLIRTRNLYLGRWFDRLCLSLSYKIPQKSSFKKTKTKGKYRSTGFRGSVDRRDVKSRANAVDNFIEQDEIEEELDKLLARVKKVGFENLSERDKQRLIELSKKI